jgi:hypothetical protein
LDLTDTRRKWENSSHSDDSEDDMEQEQSLSDEDSEDEIVFIERLKESIAECLEKASTQLKLSIIRVIGKETPPTLPAHTKSAPLTTLRELQTSSAPQQELLKATTEVIARATKSLYEILGLEDGLRCPSPRQPTAQEKSMSDSWSSVSKHQQEPGQH